MQKRTTQTEHDGTDGTSFTRADSEGGIFMCVAEHTRNVDGTTLSLSAVSLSLFPVSNPLNRAFLALFRLFWALFRHLSETDGTNSSFTRAAWRALFRCSVCSVSKCREKHTALLLRRPAKTQKTRVFTPEKGLLTPFLLRKTISVSS
jgi:hypothetical protein